MNIGRTGSACCFVVTICIFEDRNFKKYVNLLDILTRMCFQYIMRGASRSL